MGKALYRTYRSSSFDEVLGQDHVTQTLKNALKNGHISHAYLLTGPRGVGKTSVARILAHGVNNLDYSHDQQHIDIIEIDAASNRRIDEIRELRERVMVAPTAAKYKVYIIDEVHMLTREAFNALLKTLEEPPAHVIFILATTEFHKLPETIVSRCLRFNFKPIEVGTATMHLRHIAESEGLEIDDAALELIARHGDGSFRDSISQLDQIRGLGGRVSLADVQRMLGTAPEDKIQALLQSITGSNPAELLEVLADLYGHGAAPDLIAKQLSAVLRADLINKNLSLTPEAAMHLLKELLEVQASSRAKAQLELTLLDTLLASSTPEAVKILGKKTSEVPKENVQQKPAVRDVPADVPPLSEPLLPPEENIVTPAPPPLSPAGILEDDNRTWQTILAALKAKNNTLYSIARMAHTEFFEDKLVLTFTFAFHHKQISEPKNKSLISEVVRSKYPDIVTLDIKLANKPPTTVRPSTTESSTTDPTLTSISNIFGGGEVLDS